LCRSSPPEHALDGLTAANRRDKLSGMKKVTAAQYLRKFDPESLKPGQTILVTKNGKPYLEVKKAAHSRRKTPNLAAETAWHPYDPKPVMS